MGTQSPACEGIQAINDRCELLELCTIIQPRIVSVNLHRALINLLDAPDSRNILQSSAPFLYLKLDSSIQGALLLGVRPQKRFIARRAEHVVVRTQDMVSTKSVLVTSFYPGKQEGNGRNVVTLGELQEERCPEGESLAFVRQGKCSHDQFSSERWEGGQEFFGYTDDRTGEC